MRRNCRTRRTSSRLTARVKGDRSQQHIPRALRINSCEIATLLDVHLHGTSLVVVAQAEQHFASDGDSAVAASARRAVHAGQALTARL